MPDITLCENQTCPLRDNCKRGLLYNDEKPNQSWAYFDCTYCTRYKDYSYGKYESVYCEFQLKINEL